MRLFLALMLALLIGAPAAVGHDVRTIGAINDGKVVICNIEVTEPDPELMRHVNRAAAFMRSRGYKVPREFGVWVGSDEQLRDCADSIAFVDDDGMTLSRSVAEDIKSGEGQEFGHYVLRHELAHTVSDMTAPRGAWTQGDRDAAEGAADAAASDTEVAYRKFVLRRSPLDFKIAGAYPAQERMVRGMSQRATGQVVGSRAAVAWRRAYLNATTDVRRAMWQDANDRHENRRNQ